MNSVPFVCICLFEFVLSFVGLDLGTKTCVGPDNTPVFLASSLFDDSLPSILHFHTKTRSSNCTPLLQPSSSSSSQPVLSSASNKLFDSPSF